jgi:hypothetical protein
MKKYHIEMEVVTPLSVGAGNDNEWMPGADFVQKEDKVYVLDIHKAMAQGVDIEALSNLFVRSDEKGICKLLGNKLENCSRYVFKKPASTSNSIKAFLRTQLYDLPVVAGSSLKGSVRSALFKSFRSPNETDNVSVFGTMNNGTDYMRFVHVSDFEMPSTILVNTKLFNLRRENGEWQGGWKHKREMTTANYSSDGFNTLYECVEPGEKGYGSIVLEDSAYNLLINTAEISHPEKKTRLMANGIRELFHIINDATRSYLQKEQHFFERYRAERTEELIDCIEKLISMIPDDDSSCLIKMSAGVGYHSIIGDWKYTDYTATGEWESGKNVGKHKYKSRKTAEYKGRLMLMGFVKLSCLSGSDADSIAGELQEEHQEIIDNIMTPILEREKARLEAEAEERLRLEMRAAEERRKDTYLQLMQNAKTLFDENRWNDAIAKAQEAAAVCPESTEHIPFIEQCNKAKDIADYETEQKDKDKALFQKELSFVLQGKTSVGNIIGTTAKWLKYNHTFGECELQVLTDCLKGMPTKEIKKKRKDLEKAIQQEWANKVLIALGIQ